MVRIFKRRWHEAYEKIKQDSLDGNCIVFVASDVDALCACKILQVMLLRLSTALPTGAWLIESSIADAIEDRFYSTQDCSSFKLFGLEGSEY